MTEAQRLWSVTTLIKAGLGSGDALIGWAARVTAERAFDQSSILGGYLRQWEQATDEAGRDNARKAAIKWMQDARWESSGSAAIRGVAVHKIIEAYALGKEPEYPPEFEPYAVQVRRYLDEFKPEFIAAEAPVYNLELGYAGTLDTIQKLAGIELPVQVDCKTTDKGPNAKTATGRPAMRPPYPEIALQLVAYARAQVLGVNAAQMYEKSGRRYYTYDPALRYEPMPELGGSLALVVSPEDYRLIPVRTDDEVWQSFAYVREAARWQLDISQRVFGPQVSPSAQEALPL
jgi:hypothetical protein